ncbi:TIGR02594 family protein [Pedobacter sp. WC2423]|uniref:TIGR02594 family protein n=1 Tax=Pedobacter sp. WC2423 TaxID=3234142 RepID=UPI003465D4CF
MMGKLFTGIDVWLNNAEYLPKELQEAIRHNGLLETKGANNNVDIMKWAKLLGVDGWYPADKVPWCGLFKGICAYRSNKLKLPAPKLLSSLWWRTWGVKVDIKNAMVGDTAIKERDGGGHVTYIIGENDKYFRCYGGNQSDSVCATWILKSDITDVRRAVFGVQPLGVKKHYYNNLDGSAPKTRED